MQVKFAFNLSRVWQHFGEGSFAILTAYLSDLPAEENEKRLDELKGEIREKGYGYHDVEGVWKNPERDLAIEIEDSLFIPGCTPEDAIWFGTEGWKDPADQKPQYSIIYAEGPENVTYHILATDEKVTWPKMFANFQEAWEAWSDDRGKRFKFGPGDDSKTASQASVEYRMFVPRDPPKSSLEAMALQGWKNPNAVNEYRPTRDKVVIKKAKDGTGGLSCK